MAATTTAQKKTPNEVIDDLVAENPLLDTLQETLDDVQAAKRAFAEIAYLFRNLDDDAVTLALRTVWVTLKSFETSLSNVVDHPEQHGG